jgi:hypothetical protein
MFMNWGSIYAVSWWGNVNEANGWGSVYPFDADGSLLTVDTNTITTDTIQYRASATEY